MLLRVRNEHERRASGLSVLLRVTRSELTVGVDFAGFTCGDRVWRQGLETECEDRVW